jgi:hypothetical protein
MKTIQCLVCKTNKRVQDSSVGKYCSRSCKSAAAERIEAICPGCNQVVFALKSQRRGKRVYCSKTCRHEHERWRKNCEACGKEYRPCSSKQKYCSKSCSSFTRPTNFKDGRTRHQHYARWYNMMRRCTSPGHPEYLHYGGRGIIVCEEWRDPFNFYSYLDYVLGPCPKGHSLDRIDNDGNYEPGNIQWASFAKQFRNRRPYMVRPDRPNPRARRKMQIANPSPGVWRIGKF